MRPRWCAGDSVLSYGELAVQTGRLAWYLAVRGAGPEQVVGLCLDRGPELVTAILGTWLAGAAYLPLDREWPGRRLGWMLADAGARLVITSGVLPAGMSVPDDVTVVDLDNPVTAAELAAPPAARPPGRPGRAGHGGGVPDLTPRARPGLLRGCRSPTADW